MQTATHLETDSLIRPRSFDGLSWIARLTIRTFTELWTTVGATQVKRYRMQHEDLLHGPLSNEARRMRW